MAESPIKITQIDDGLYVRYELDVHYVSDEDAKHIRGYIDQLQAENAKLRELAERAWKTAERLCQAFDGPCSDNDVTSYKPCPMGMANKECVYGQLQRELHELGVEVDG